MPVRFDPPHVSFDPDTESLAVEAPAVGVRVAIGAFRKGAPLRVFVDGRVESSWDDPGLAPFSAADDLPADHPVRRYLDTVPGDARALVARFEDHQIVALRFLGLGPAALELARSAPSLVALLLPRMVGTSPRRAADRLGARRQELLAWALGRDATPEMVRFVERYAPARRDAESREVLERALLAPAVVPALRHAPALSLVRVRAATQLASWLHLASVRHAVTSGADPLVAYAGPQLARDAMRLAHLLRIPAADASAAVRRARSIDELRALHDRWTVRTRAVDDERLVERLAKTHGTTRFPLPPVAGDARIVHVATVDELLREGREMRHCVGGYADACFLGQSFIYRVVAPERATLELRMRDGVPVVRQLKLVHNGAPGAATWEAVRAWLRGAGR